MGSHRDIQLSETIAHLAGDFFARESNRQSLVTVTRAEVSNDLKTVTVYFSVLPEKYEEDALNFAKRKRTDFREYLKEHSALRYLPTIDFALDMGEKNRQKIEELTRK
ncbi:MAG: ribosome-binding factor A [Candidatus Kaiserbacteria bacterium]|nr:ribosome-binding factor A [Candidatus Kaiserbacteria bacterium]